MFLILQATLYFSGDKTAGISESARKFFLKDPLDELNRLNSEYEQRLFFLRNNLKIHSLLNNGKIGQSNRIDYKNAIDLFLNKEQNTIFKDYKPVLNEHQDKIIFPDEVRSNLNQSQYTILEYTKIGSGMKFCNMSFPSNKKEGHQDFLYLDTCAYSNCIFTCDKSLVNTADAFLTHLTDVEAELNQDSQARDEFFSKF